MHRIGAAHSQTCTNRLGVGRAGKELTGDALWNGGIVPDSADAVTHADAEEPAVLEVNKFEKKTVTTVRSLQGRFLCGTFWQGGGFYRRPWLGIQWQGKGGQVEATC